MVGGLRTPHSRRITRHGYPEPVSKPATRPVRAGERRRIRRRFPSITLAMSVYRTFMEVHRETASPARFLPVKHADVSAGCAFISCTLK